MLNSPHSFWYYFRGKVTEQSRRVENLTHRTTLCSLRRKDASVPSGTKNLQTLPSTKEYTAAVRDMP